MIFWTGGRVAREETNETVSSGNATNALMYTVVPSPIEKHMILVSPNINNNYLPVLL